MFNFLNKTKPVKIIFLIDMVNRRERMTWKYIKIIDKISARTISQTELQLLAAHFMVDENDVYLPEEKAVAILDDLPQDEVLDVLNQFTASIANSAVNPPNGSGSRLPLELGQTTDALPRG